MIKGDIFTAIRDLGDCSGILIVREVQIFGPEVKRNEASMLRKRQGRTRLSSHMEHVLQREHSFMGAADASVDS